MIYLDYAAATPVDEQVVAAMTQASRLFANADARYTSARLAGEMIDKSLHTIGQFLNCKNSEIIITSGSTEANNLAIFGTLTQPHSLHAITSATEHSSVLSPLQHLASQGLNLTILQATSDGQVDIDALQKLITDSTTLISISLVCNETGVVAPVSKIAKIVTAERARRFEAGVATPLYLHTDATAAAWLMPLRVDRLGIDMLTLGGAKLYGPHHVGALYVKAGVELKPQIIGGGQQAGRRAGTLDTAGIAGLAVAIEQIEKNRQLDFEQMNTLQQLLRHKLQIEFPPIIFHGTPKRLLPSICNFSLPGYDAETLVSYLDARDIAVGTGAACNAARSVLSTTLRGMGLTEKEIQSSLRLSFGRETTEKDIQDFVANLTEIVARLDTM